MSPVLVALSATIAIVCTWGLIAPRSQWRALVGWAVSDPDAQEPGPASYAIRRVLFAVGLSGTLVVLGGAWLTYLDSLPKPPRQLTPLELMWGNPEPDLVNRIVEPMTAPPEGLVQQPILGFQTLETGAPGYLEDLDVFRRVGGEAAGYIGESPPEGSSAAATAELLLHARGGLLCIPREVVVIETEESVQVGLFYGLPDSEDGSVPDHAAACSPEPSVSLSLLIPVPLAAVVGEREVLGLDGAALQRVYILGEPVE